MTIILLTKCTLAQQLQLNGVVRTESDSVIIGATISSYTLEGKTLKFTTTDGNGEFKLQLPKQGDIKITVRSLGYLDTTFSITGTDLLSNEVHRVIILKPQAVELEEVVIKQNYGEADSVALDIENLGLSESSSLKEILSRMPEFRLDDDGTIIYRGRNIDKININGRQMFVNQNKIALQSIEKRMIDHLNLINNYQDNFKLNFEDTKETVLDIKAKTDFTNVLIGDVEAGYGASNKYDMNGKLLFFSEPINAFLTHSTNNIGGINMEERELSALFGKDQVFSELDRELINGILSSNQARARDFRSNTNATVRKETNRYRIQTVAYFMANEQETSSGTQNISENGNPVLSSRDQRTNDYRALFHTTSFDYRIKDNMLLDYQIITYNIRNDGHSDRKVTLFDNNVPSLENMLSSTSRSTSHYIFNHLGISGKFADRWIATVRLGYHHSGFLYPVTLNFGENSTEIGNQDAAFKLNGLDAVTQLKFRLKKTFIPMIGYEEKHIWEKVEYEPFNHEGTQYDRNYLQRRIKVEISGDDLLKYLKYNVNLDVLRLGLLRNSDIYYPFKLNLSLDKHLDSWYLKANRQYFQNDISYGITLVRDFTDIQQGSPELAPDVNRMENYTFGYGYTNLFRGYSYGFSLNHQIQGDKILPNYDRTDEFGMRVFTLRQIPKSRETKLSVTGSKNLFGNVYPVKSDLSLEYTFGNSPSYFSECLSDVLHNGPSIRLGIQSLSPDWFNFELSGRANLYQVKIDNNSFDNKSLNNLLTLKARKHSFETKLEFIYQLDFLYGNRFDRKNINLIMEKRGNKFTYGFKGLNIDDFFGLFNNSAYNNYVIYDQGINTLVTSDRAIRYAIFYLKYTFH